MTSAEFSRIPRVIRSSDCPTILLTFIACLRKRATVMFPELRLNRKHVGALSGDFTL